jgi:phosphate uptake regulator
MERSVAVPEWQGVSSGVSDDEGRIMRATFDAELGELITSLARMTRHSGQMMTNAAIALHQTDLTLAGVVIAACDQMTSSLDETEQRCVALLAPPAPVAGDLRV